MTTLAGPISGNFFAGNDIELAFTVSVDGNPVDITGAITRFTLARDQYTIPVLVSADVDFSMGEAAQGKFQVFASAEDTEGLNGTYLYQAQVQDGSGNISNVLHGWFTFLPNIVE